MSRRAGKGLESFLEVVCFNLTEHEPVRSHSEPFHAIFGQEDMKCLLVEQEDMSSRLLVVFLTKYGENRFTMDRHGLMFSQIEAYHLQEAF